MEWGILGEIQTNLYNIKKEHILLYNDEKQIKNETIIQDSFL